MLALHFANYLGVKSAALDGFGCHWKTFEDHPSACDEDSTKPRQAIGIARTPTIVPTDICLPGFRAGITALKGLNLTAPSSLPMLVMAKAKEKVMTSDFVKQIRKATRRRFTAEKKIRIGLEGLRKEIPVTSVS